MIALRPKARRQARVRSLLYADALSSLVAGLVLSPDPAISLSPWGLPPEVR
jgi:hypothetical protein